MTWSLRPTPWRPSRLDSAGSTAVGVVTGDTFPVVPGPRVPASATVIYEAHVKGLTYQLPGVPEELRGTYAGLAHSVTVEHLKALGITTIELLPIHASVSEPFLTKRGLSNYWGYSTLSYFAPEPSYATAAARAAGRRRSWTRSAAWSPCSTRPAWRSCSTSSTTTPARAVSTALLEPARPG